MRTRDRCDDATRSQGSSDAAEPWTGIAVSFIARKEALAFDD